MVPETEEYGISSFVYRSRKPFVPQKIHDLIVSNFLLQERADGDENDDTETTVSFLALGFSSQIQRIASTPKKTKREKRLKMMASNNV